jgi:hypothetical protein
VRSTVISIRPFGRLSLQARLKRADLTCGASNGSIKHGFKETEASITNKLKRGTFPATWFLAALAALEVDGVALDEN